MSKSDIRDAAIFALQLCASEKRSAAFEMIVNGLGYAGNEAGQIIDEMDRAWSAVWEKGNGCTRDTALDALDFLLDEIGE